MNKKLVIEVHVGKRYGISRLNCDGAGQVKDVLIDNSRYNRISSQSKKRVWREHLEECLGEMEHVYRTRAIKDILMKNICGNGISVISGKCRRDGRIYRKKYSQM